MKRRDFIQASAAVGSVWTTQSLVRSAENSDLEARQYYEWRTYHAASVEQRQRVSDFVERAALPAWGRAGVGPVGVFTDAAEPANYDLHVLLTFPAFEMCRGERTTLEADAEYQSAAAEYLGARMDDPAFTSIDSWWLVAFAAQPQLATPRRKPRYYELRTYHSHSEAKARRKIEMFNAGEIPIFRDAGFETVFFGESLVGSGLPHLKYMLAAPDKAANESGWRKFINHPDWAAMKDLPQYADTVSRIDKLFLEPTDYSLV